MDSDNRRKRTRLSRRERDDVVAAFRESGMTQKAFAESRGLSAPTLRTWIYAERAARAPAAERGGFVEVALSASGPAVATLRLDGGLSIEFPLSELERVAAGLAREFARR